MKYMLLIYGEEKTWDKATREKCYRESAELVEQLNEAGQFLAASPLYPSTTATTVRVRNDERLITDGPFAETNEQLGGYFLIDARNLDEAINIAGRIPGARIGTIEIRPVVEIPGLSPE